MEQGFGGKSNRSINIQKKIGGRISTDCGDHVSILNDGIVTLSRIVHTFSTARIARPSPCRADVPISGLMRNKSDDDRSIIKVSTIISFPARVLRILSSVLKICKSNSSGEVLENVGYLIPVFVNTQNIRTFSRAGGMSCPLEGRIAIRILQLKLQVILRTLVGPGPHPFAEHDREISGVKLFCGKSGRQQVYPLRPRIPDM